MNEENELNQEEERIMRLEQNRRKAESAKQSTLKDAAPKIAAGSAIAMLCFVVGSDLADAFVVGSIPIVGDGLDIVTGFSIWLWVKTSGLDRQSPLVAWSPWIATGVEFIPIIGDLPPSYTIDVMIIILMNSQNARKAMKYISPI